MDLLARIEALMGDYNGHPSDFFNRYRWHLQHGEIDLALAAVRANPDARERAQGLVRIVQAMQCREELYWLWPVDWISTRNAANGRGCPPLHQPGL